jgi:uncharacterized membrane protein HdeD (DUF308 family)
MIIGLILAILALGVLFDKLPGNEIAWLVVLLCAIALMVVGVTPVNINWPIRRQPPA